MHEQQMKNLGLSPASAWNYYKGRACGLWAVKELNKYACRPSAIRPSARSSASFSPEEFRGLCAPPCSSKFQLFAGGACFSHPTQQPPFASLTVACVLRPGRYFPIQTILETLRLLRAKGTALAWPLLTGLPSQPFLTILSLRYRHQLSKACIGSRSAINTFHTYLMDHSGMAGMAGMSGMPMEQMSRPKPDHSDMAMMNTFFVAETSKVPLWFDGWTPANAGATFGACVGLFALTVAVKLLGALRHQAHLAWSMTKWHDSGLATHQTVDKADNAAQPPTGTFRTTRPAVHWGAQRDIPRGILAALHVGLEYFLMLAVMTYNVYFFVAIILGHFVGEVVFGRWSTVQGAHC
ncbi:hypothetical protein PCANC_18362 [Puccinia coronata f. sp. avenae]|uniref:Copper transport protein n=1 Tax=Puccinia coronata f. sp. avenae TaxID=200324 RepID=A0A2N5UBF2_9BASI|nr:hypothetical protein PCANC_19985 [Puccinia coronata f. sp. avenae]PLW22106.1 hypothetical protein PCANC_28123 [Puccinia coronata f. sp. avenae]PLW35066.1 hypothetical protein PCASD_16171 [Puccinia coronata f. sp. avenae]PLW43801.1 hypothetical protein PCANC_18362 [Puccinia coronata f. sp. avenae]